VPEALSKGLRNVYLDETEASFIDGEKGILLYRGYSIHDLAPNCSFEEVAHLMLYGKLPDRAELNAFDRRLRGQRALPAAVIETIRLVATPWTSCARPSPRSPPPTPTSRTSRPPPFCASRSA
jgi:citrate synthase